MESGASPLWTSKSSGFWTKNNHIITVLVGIHTAQGSQQGLNSSSPACLLTQRRLRKALWREEFQGEVSSTLVLLKNSSTESSYSSASWAWLPSKPLLRFKGCPLPYSYHSFSAVQISAGSPAPLNTQRGEKIAPLPTHDSSCSPKSSGVLGPPSTEPFLLWYNTITKMSSFVPLLALSQEARASSHLYNVCLHPQRQQLVFFSKLDSS